MECTDRGKKNLKHTYGVRYSALFGFIIKQGESLCFGCASKRTGFRELAHIEKERRSK